MKEIDKRVRDVMEEYRAWVLAFWRGYAPEEPDVHLEVQTRPYADLLRRSQSYLREMIEEAGYEVPDLS
jgi:hypothetical protein